MLFTFASWPLLDQTAVTSGWADVFSDSLEDVFVMAVEAPVILLYHLQASGSLLVPAEDFLCITQDSNHLFSIPCESLMMPVLVVQQSICPPRDCGGGAKCQLGGHWWS